MSSYRIWSLLLVIALGALSVSIGLQYFAGYLPCSLCIIQRYSLVFILVATLCGILSGWRRGPAFLGLVAAACGTITSSFHVYVLRSPATSCGREPLADWLNGLPFAEWAPALFQVTGVCTQETPSFFRFGPSLPVWSLMIFGMVMALLVFMVVSLKHARSGNMR